jgi:hypothetical protein
MRYEMQGWTDGEIPSPALTMGTSTDGMEVGTAMMGLVGTNGKVFGDTRFHNLKEDKYKRHCKKFKKHDEPIYNVICMCEQQTF